MKFIYHNTATGKISLYLDGMLRPFPDMDTFLALYGDFSDSSRKIEYTDDSQVTYPFGPELNKGTKLYKVSSSPEIYLLDDFGTKTLNYRHIIDMGTFNAYGFNLQLVTIIKALDPSKPKGCPVRRVSKTLYLMPTTLSPELITSINRSGFTTINVFQIRILGTNPAIIFGDDYDDECILAANGVFNPNGYDELADYNSNLTALKLNGIKGSVNRLMLTLGGWEPIFQSIYNILNPVLGKDGKTIEFSKEGVDQLTKNFKAVKDNLPAIDGIDLDNEDLAPNPINCNSDSINPNLSYTQSYQYPIQSFVKLCQILASVGFSLTFCPYYYNDSFWSKCLSALEISNPGLVTEYNLQCYAGGSGNSPGTFAPGTPDGFIIPGLSNEISPQDVKNKLNGWKSKTFTPDGGFIWCSSDILNKNQSLKEYADALVITQPLRK